MIRMILGIALLIGSFVFLMVMTVGDPTAMGLGAPLASAVCEPGETILREFGPTVYNNFENVNETPVFYYCVNAAGDRREVTDQMVGTMIAGFAIALVIGLLFLLWGIFGMIRGRMRRMAGGLNDVVGGGFGQFGSSPVVGSSPVIGGSPVGFSGSNPVVGAPDSAQGGPTVFTSGVSTTGQSSTFVTVNGQPVNQVDLPPGTAQALEKAFSILGVSMDAMNQSGTVMGGDVAGQGDLADRLKQLQEARDNNLITQEEYDRMRKAILDSLGKS